MEKQNVMSKVRMAFDTFLQYWCDHSAAQEALTKVYSRNWREEDPEGNYAIQLLINPDGNLYRVTQRYFVNGTLIREESFLATYAWQSNGHLVGIGNYRYLIVDPVNQLIYMEDSADSGPVTLEEYHQIKI